MVSAMNSGSSGLGLSPGQGTAHISVKPEGGTPGICGASEFSEEFLAKSLPWGKRMGQISSNIPTLGN